MKNLFFIANEYIQQSDWKDLALIKFCLFSMGVIIGLFVPSRSKKVVLMTACCVFVITYLPLMSNFFRVMFAKPYSRDF